MEIERNGFVRSEKARGRREEGRRDEGDETGLDRGAASYRSTADRVKLVQLANILLSLLPWCLAIRFLIH